MIPAPVMTTRGGLVESRNGNSTVGIVLNSFKDGKWGDGGKSIGPVGVHASACPGLRRAEVSGFDFEVCDAGSSWTFWLS